MTENDKPYNISYVFYIQSVEDFHNQLREFHRQDTAQEDEIDVEDLSVAEEMLQAIGIATK
jgi:hypothetical protein